MKSCEGWTVGKDTIPADSFKLEARSGNTYYAWSALGECFASDGKMAYLLSRENLPMASTDPASPDGILRYDLKDCLNYLNRVIYK